MHSHERLLVVFKSVNFLRCEMLQPSLIGHEVHLLEQAAQHDVFNDDDESEFMWRAPPLLTLADIPYLIDETVEPGVTLRY